MPRRAAQATLQALYEEAQRLNRELWADNARLLEERDQLAAQLHAALIDLQEPQHDEPPAPPEQQQQQQHEGSPSGSPTAARTTGHSMASSGSTAFPSSASEAAAAASGRASAHRTGSRPSSSVAARGTSASAGSSKPPTSPTAGSGRASGGRGGAPAPSQPTAAPRGSRLSPLAVPGAAAKPSEGGDNPLHAAGQDAAATAISPTGSSASDRLQQQASVAETDSASIEDFLMMAGASQAHTLPIPPVHAKPSSPLPSMPGARDPSRPAAAGATPSNSGGGRSAATIPVPARPPIPAAALAAALASSGGGSSVAHPGAGHHHAHAAMVHAGTMTGGSSSPAANPTRWPTRYTDASTSIAGMPGAAAVQGAAAAATTVSVGTTPMRTTMASRGGAQVSFGGACGTEPAWAEERSPGSTGPHQQQRARVGMCARDFLPAGAGEPSGGAAARGPGGEPAPGAGAAGAAV